ncbi:hypothetical protein OSB04_018204 [Centaurea solstitialis]|uniref:Reverse transcriptase Ty1/copia-type domain-containing protein n=1 Tax=Centaurea solstitialis TaxID=347529 RepID=A0AA38T4D0_9ASTR|nr:hypothetical protein OSB04_018204 [Centaurea solstitialis]
MYHKWQILVQAPCNLFHNASPSHVSTDIPAAHGPIVVHSQVPPTSTTLAMTRREAKFYIDLRIEPVPLQPYLIQPNGHQVISNTSAPIKTRSATQNECLFVVFLSNHEPSHVTEALDISDWVTAMQEELNKFERLGVWILVPKPKNKSIIDLKWIFNDRLADRLTDRLTTQLGTLNTGRPKKDRYINPPSRYSRPMSHHRRHHYSDPIEVPTFESSKIPTFQSKQPLIPETIPEKVEDLPKKVEEEKALPDDTDEEIIEPQEEISTKAEVSEVDFLPTVEEAGSQSTKDTLERQESFEVKNDVSIAVASNKRCYRLLSLHVG